MFLVNLVDLDLQNYWSFQPNHQEIYYDLDAERN